MIFYCNTIFSSNIQSWDTHRTRENYEVLWKLWNELWKNLIILYNINKHTIRIYQRFNKRHNETCGYFCPTCGNICLILIYLLEIYEKSYCRWKNYDTGKKSHRPWQDSNLQSPDPKSGALSIRPHGQGSTQNVFAAGRIRTYAPRGKLISSQSP